jgi:hypothetical protein
VYRTKKAEYAALKYWKITGHNLSKGGWGWGCVAAVDCNGRTIFIADAHCGDGKRFGLRADEKLTTFLEPITREKYPKAAS